MPFTNQLDAPIEFYNRNTGAVESEEVYGEGFLRWAYGNPLGRITVSVAVKRHWFSRWYGWRMDRQNSHKKIAYFIERYNIDTSEFADTVESFKTFNQFFFRRLRAESRPVEPDPVIAVFPADGRHLAIENLDDANQFYIKGQSFNLAKFIGDCELADEFSGGSLLISRLCPVDYHRYHFPVCGVAEDIQMLEGSLRSVSPLALRRKLSILWENRRARTLVESQQFGKVLIMEVGATCVGGMHSTFKPGLVQKGAEKGYFSFGGSCVTTIFQKGTVRFDTDLVENSAQGREVYVKMGQRCGSSYTT